MNDLWGARAPARAAWDGWFFIAIFPNGEWCKVHRFSGGRPHCLSALEGLDGPPQEVALVGRAEHVDRRGGVVDTMGRHVTFSFDDSARVTGLGVDAVVRGGEPFFWIRVPRVLTYFTQAGPANVTIDGTTREALALIEHAWGARTRLDVARLAPRRWQWDVLSLENREAKRSDSRRSLSGAWGAEPTISSRGSHVKFFASLGFTAAGVGARGVASVDGGPGLVRVTRSQLRVLDWSTDGTRNVPARWKGTMVSRVGMLHYEARAATPVSPEVDGGGFLGFTWEGELERGPRRRAEAGAGFCEYRALI